MPFTTAAKNNMLDCGIRSQTPTIGITHVGAMTKGANITGVVSTGSPDTFTKTAHGLSDGDFIVFSAITGGTGLVAGHAYFVVSAAANTFQIALTAGGSAVDLSSDVTAATVNKLTEISGGSPAYARVAIALAAAAGGALDDSTNGAALNIPAAGVADIISFHSASTAGTLMAIVAVTPPETFGGQGSFIVTNAVLDLLNGAGA